MRIRAFKLSLANWKLLYPAVICYQLLLYTINTAVSTVGIPLLVTLVSSALTVLLSPFFVGIVAVNVRIWRKEPVSFRQLFDYYTERNRLIRVLIMSTILALISNITLFPISFLAGPAATNGAAAMLLVLLTPVIVWISLWVSIRLGSAQYILVTSDGIDPVKCVSASFSFMRGRCLRMFGFIMSLTLVPVAVLLAIFIPAAFFYPQLFIQTNVGASPLYALVSQAFIALFAPFVWLASAGYFLDVLLKTPGKPPKNKLKVNDIHRK